jgi:acyl-CoA synthetase (AMP-forming)/AMP-acid ligase II
MSGAASSAVTIPAAFRASVARRPDAEALVDGDVRLTFAELSHEVDRFARAASAAGLQLGDRAAVWAPNCAQWVIAALGLQAAGAVLVPINTRFKGDEARYGLEKVRAKLLVVADGFLGVDHLAMLRGPGSEECSAERPVPALHHLSVVVTLGATADAGSRGWDDFLQCGEDVPQEEVDRRIAALSGSDVADILFTSGTTGYPRAAMVSHESNVLVADAWSDMVGLEAGDRYLLVNPFFHSFGYRAGILTCVTRGATIVPMRVFEPEAVLDVVERERITVFPGPPAVYTTLLNHPTFADHDLSSVRLAVTGAAVVPEALVQRMRSDLGFRTVITAYGLTECCGTATVCPPDTDLERLTTSCGRAIPGTEVAIIEPGGSTVPLPAGQTGEVVIRGHNVMLGYFEDPQATAETIDPDGWLHTGDIGWMDDEGFLRITDRIKDVFMVGGFNVYPAEVERLIVTHPHVADAAVVGVPDERMGEVSHAYVVPRIGASLSEADLRAHCRSTMANFKVPRQFTLVEQLPRNAAGKVQKFVLRDAATASAR